MLFKNLIVTAVVAAVHQASAASHSHSVAARSRLEARLESSSHLRARDSQANHPPMIVRRQDVAVAPFILVENPPQNETAWNEAADAACTESLAKLDIATNPSGTCVCYNLPALDTNTGVFQADLRLYKVSEPRDEFTGIPAENIQVGLTYSGASVQQATQVGQTAFRRRDGMLMKRADPEPLQVYTFVGQIDQEQMEINAPMTMATIEALVMPVVTLTGSGGGNTISTNISMNEAAFVVGVFSDEVVLSNTAAAQLAVDEMVAGLSNGTVVFQVPGIRIMIFPVGLIITSMWTVAFLGTVGYGTIQRMNYREQFRRRTAMTRKGGNGTI